MIAMQQFTKPENMSAPLLAQDEAPAYGVVDPDGASPYVLLCEHLVTYAARAMPKSW